MRVSRPASASAADGIFDGFPSITAPRMSRLRRLGAKLERDAVHAVAQAGGLGTVWKHMAEMAAAVGAVHFGPRHIHTAVLGGIHGRVACRSEEAWPAGTALVLRLRTKEEMATGGTVELAFPFLRVQRARAGALGAMLAKDAILAGRECRLPLLVALVPGKGLVSHNLSLSI